MKSPFFPRKTVFKLLNIGISFSRLTFNKFPIDLAEISRYNNFEVIYLFEYGFCVFYRIKGGLWLMDTEIKNTVTAVNHDAQYDEKAKRLLGNKIILAHILVKKIGRASCRERV